MAVQRQTPGVYINELNAFPNSVVEVPTAVPAFIGHTAVAKSGTVDVTNRPIRITSIAEFLAIYSDLAANPPAPAAPSLDGTINFVEGSTTDLRSTTPYLLFRSLQLFYANGGGPCWIVSVGSYTDALTAMRITAALDELETEPEPTIMVTPDAVNLSESDWSTVTTAAIEHCYKMQNRVALIDIHGGDQQPTATNDPVENFRNKLSPPAGDDRALSYAMTYWPWLNTSIIEPAELDFTALGAAVRTELGKQLTTDATEPPAPTPPAAAVTTAIEIVTSGTPSTPQITNQTHETLKAASAVYGSFMSRALAAANLMPPSSAMAGIYTAVDDSVGVWKAPANVGMQSVYSPFVKISDEAQGTMNVPLDGRAVNAIRTFQGRGVMVWGARTLDGNSQDWRYISVRRTMIMLEQSIKAACEPYVFAPNDASTWVTVTAMIENFLNNQWKAGALAGSKPADAYQVNVGLGSTMTATDILDGFMRVTVKVAVTHPAEFIVLTFQQQMQTS